MARPYKLQAPIFLLASERAGTNLVRVICGSHPAICAPSPPHLLMSFLPELPVYGDLEDDESFRRLCEHVTGVLDHKLTPWSASFTAEGLFEAVDERSFMALFDHVYDRERQETGAQRVFFKENETFEHVETLLACYPDARFVYLIRDGRDVLASWLRSPTHFGTLAEGAELWSSQQRKCIAAYRRLAAPGTGRAAVHALYYEDLVTRPEETVRALCDFLGEEFAPEMLEFYSRGTVVEQARSIENWRHLARPILEQHLKLYRKRLSRRQVRRFETIAFRELRVLGFDLENPVPRLVRARRTRGLLQKGWLFLTKALRGRLMSWTEAQKRRRRVQALNRMGLDRDLHIEPILRPRVSSPGGR